MLVKLIITSSLDNLLRRSFLLRKLLILILIIIAVEIIVAALEHEFIILIRQIFLVLVIHQPFDE